jgi:hypothetical protein
LATYVRLNIFAIDLVSGNHDFDAHVFKVLLSNTIPAATLQVRGSASELATAGGYTSGGGTTTIGAGGITQASTSGVKVAGSNVVFTATTGFGPFQSTVLYNDTPTTPADPCIANWNYGSSISLLASETFTWDTATAGNGIFTIT